MILIIFSSIIYKKYQSPLFSVPPEVFRARSRNLLFIEEKHFTNPITLTIIITILI